MTLQALFEELHRRQITAVAQAPGFDFAEDTGPWYTSVLLGVMGWAGGMLVLGFFVSLIAGLLNSAAGAAALSIILFGAGLAIYRAFPANAFATQFALSASLCGQVLAVFAFDRARIFHGEDSFTLAAWFAAAMQLFLVWLMPNFLHRLLSTMFAVLALFAATRDGSGIVLVNAGLALAFVSLTRIESTVIARGQRALAEPVMIGIAIGLLTAGTAYLNLFGHTPLRAFAPISAMAFGIALALWVALATRHAERVRSIVAIAAAVTFSATAWRAPGLIAAALVLLASFGQGRRMLTTLAVVALVGYLSTYYYQLEFTLALKAAVLAATGAVLLVCWWLHRTYFPVEGA